MMDSVHIKTSFPSSLKINEKCQSSDSILSQSDTWLTNQSLIGYFLSQLGARSIVLGESLLWAGIRRLPYFCQISIDLFTIKSPLSVGICEYICEFHIIDLFLCRQYNTINWKLQINSYFLLCKVKKQCVKGFAKTYLLSIKLQI